MQITKLLRFEAAHVLPKHPGKCSRLHGHSYLLEVTIEGFVQPETGFVVDFADLSSILRDKVFDILDHRFINDVLLQEGWPGESSAENLSYFIWSRINRPITALGVVLAEISLWETKDSKVTLTDSQWDASDFAPREQEGDANEDR